MKSSFFALIVLVAPASGRYVRLTRQRSRKQRSHIHCHVPRMASRTWKGRGSRSQEALFTRCFPTRAGSFLAPNRRPEL